MLTSGKLKHKLLTPSQMWTMTDGRTNRGNTIWGGGGGGGGNAFKHIL